jgi:DNA polymerase/3'-5' exonuclease PolX
MSTGTRLPLAEAQHIAGQIVGQLDPACVRLAIAGSIRRGRPDVGDIELVAIPRFRQEPSSLWGDKTEVSVLAEKLAIEEADHVLERISGGERYVKLRHLRSGLQVDLFLVLPPASWGVIFAIRTGPADYSQWLVTYARRQGMHVCGGSLRRGLGVYDDCTRGRECCCPVIPTPEERDLYAALGMPWVEPGERRVP